MLLLRGSTQSLMNLFRPEKALYSYFRMRVKGRLLRALVDTDSCSRSDAVPMQLATQRLNAELNKDPIHCRQVCATTLRSTPVK